MAFLCHQIVDQHADITLGAIDDQRFLSLKLPCRVDPCHQALSRRFLISGASVELTAAKKSFDLAEFQGWSKLPGVDTVVFNGIGVPHDLHMLKPRNRPVHGVLDVLGKRTGHAADIHFVSSKAFRLDKHLMPVLIRKFHHFIFNGRAVSWPRSLDHTGEERRAVQIGPDDLVGLLIGIGKPAGNLVDLHILRICGEGKGHYPLIAKLLLHPGEIHGIPVDPGRRPGFEAIHLDSQILQAFCQMIGCLESIWPCVHTHIPVDTPGPEIGAGTQDHGPAGDHHAGIDLHACNLIVFRQDLYYFRLLNLQVLLILQYLAHSRAVAVLVRLSPQRMDRRPFGTVQHLGLDEGPVNHLPHLASQSVHLTHQMALGTPSDIGIAGHKGDAVYAHSEHDGLESHPGTGQRSLAACMAGADHRHVIVVFIFPYRIC